jgi:hypothetical protein
MGSPELGIAILVGPRRTAVETLSFLLDGQVPDAAQDES